MRPDAGKDRVQTPGSGRNGLPAAEKERKNATAGRRRGQRHQKPPEIPPAKTLSPWYEKCRLVELARVLDLELTLVPSKKLPAVRAIIRGDGDSQRDVQSAR